MSVPADPDRTPGTPQPPADRPAPAQPWSVRARDASRRAPTDRERVRLGKARRFQRNLEEIVAREQADDADFRAFLLPVISWLFPVFIGALSYGVVIITGGSGWSRAAIELGVSLAVVAGVASAKLWGMWRGEVDDDDLSQPDPFAADNVRWSLRPQRRRASLSAPPPAQPEIAPPPATPDRDAPHT